MRSNQIYKYKFQAVAVSVVFCLSAGAPAMAQPKILEEIIVTAKAREQNLQDVPLAISVLGEKDLEVRGISDVQDLADFTPNLEINSPFGRRDAVLSVRGLGSSTTDERYQSVGFFVDGIWMGGQIVGMSTADVERIEIIKSPHSTFGRATYGASIDYVTKTPSLEELSGSIKGQFSDMGISEDSNREITATISGPIVPGKVSGSLYAQQNFESGIAPAAGGSTNSVGEQETTVLSGVLYTEFSENTSLKLRAFHTEDEDTFINGFESRPQYWVQQGANLVSIANTDPTQPDVFWISGEVPDPLRQGYYSSDVTAAHIGGTQADSLERERTFFSAIFEHDFDNGFSLKYSGSYMDQEEHSLFDGIAAVGSLGGMDPILGDVNNLLVNLGGFNNVISEEWEEISHTLRLLSPEDGQLTWSVGAHYYDSENTNYTPNQAFIDLFRSFGRDVDDFGRNRTEEIDTVAVFGSVNYQINDQFRFSLEGRYQDETVTRKAVPDALFSSQRLGTDIERSESNFDPRITLSYEPNDDNHLYILYAEGHKSGRFNFGGPGFLPGTTLNDPDGWIYVEPEGLDNYEFGWKSTFLNGRGRSNIAIFFQDITDQQFVSTVPVPLDVNPTGFETRLANVGESEIYGLDADLTFAATENLVLQAAVGFNDQEFQTDIDPQSDENLYLFQLAGDAPGEETLKGKTFTNVSAFSANFSATYSDSTAFMGANEWSVRTDVLYKGKKYVDTANLAHIPANTRVNLRGNLRAENWNMSVFVKNVFDDKTAYRGNSFICGILSVTDPAVASTLGLAAPAPSTNLADDNNGGFPQRCLSLIPSSSREVGLSLEYNF